MAKRLSEYSTFDLTTKIESLDDYQDQEVTVTGCRTAKGAFGDYMMVDIVDKDGELHTISCGGMVVMDALQNAKLHKAFPLEAKFAKSGRTWVIE